MQAITYLFIVLACLWLADLYQTLKITRKYGIKAEENPVARFLLKHNRSDFVAFKLLDLFVLLAVLWLIFEKQDIYAACLTALFILFYAITVLHNWKAFRKHRKTLKKDILQNI